MPLGAQYVLVLPLSSVIFLPCFAPPICMIHNLLDLKVGDVPLEIQMLRVFSPNAVIVSPTTALLLRGDRPLGCIGGLKAFLTHQQVNSSLRRAAPPNSSQ
jgi:hypothetical protein